MEHWEFLEEELIWFPSLIEAQAVADWIRSHDTAHWRPVPHPRDCPPPAPPAETTVTRAPRPRKARAAGRR